MKKLILISLVSIVFASCFKEIDTVPLVRTVESTFTVQNSIQTTQTYFTLYENTAQEASVVAPSSWDLAFESAGDGSKVMQGWASGSMVHKTGKNIITDVSEDEVLDYMNNSYDWLFDDPAYTNYPDSLSLQTWEDGEVYIQNRGVVKDNFYLIQFVSKTDDSYTFNYAKVTDNQNVNTYTINRSDGLNYVYFSFDENAPVSVEPRSYDWDFVFSPYLGWWETLTQGEYSPYKINGVLINNESGVRVAQIFDESIDFEDINETHIATSEFTDWKGVIGSNWKLLGGTDSENLYTMDPDKKYILKKYDSTTGVFKYFKLRMIDYKLNGVDHFPTVEFKFLTDE
ncbi:MAG: hypothetical protein B6I20_06655 [Bacteroidetes bacterium 4572_117]|nr:MAG: hypothetical protein B6I20_06655 [Bacteroidetes bacterium 4572_117]